MENILKKSVPCILDVNEKGSNILHLCAENTSRKENEASILLREICTHANIPKKWSSLIMARPGLESFLIGFTQQVPPLSLVFTFPARCFADVSHAYWWHAELDNLDKTGAVKQVDGTILVTDSVWPLCWCVVVASTIKSRRGSWPRKFFYSMGPMKE